MFIENSYLEDPDFSHGNDIAMGIFKGDLPQQGISCFEGQLSSIETELVKPGDTICVIGYPGEKDGQLYQM